jgi:D-alanine-D-alanine ligase
MQHKADTAWEQVDSLLACLSNIRDSVAVHLVACVKGATSPVRDFETHSLETEFFSEQELAYLTGCLRDFGLFVRLFTSESSFIECAIQQGAHEKGFERIVVYNTAHSGTGAGRKALVPAFCDLKGIAYTGSDPHAASLARHKFHCGCVLRNCGRPVPDSWLYSLQHGWLAGDHPPDGARVILKLTHESASIGLSAESVLIADETLSDRVHAIAAVFKQPVTVQRFIAGREVEVPIVHLDASFAPLVVAISLDGNQVLGDSILTYDVVNDDRYGFSRFGETSEEAANAIRDDALAAAQILGFRGLSRVDFRIDQSGQHYITDLATSPHITPHSSFEFAFRQFGRQGKLPLLLIALAAKRARWIQDSDQN